MHGCAPVVLHSITPFDRRMRDAVQTARGALVGDLTDIMMTTREEEKVMASIARLDAQLHSTAAHRYSKGDAAGLFIMLFLKYCRCCRRSQF